MTEFALTPVERFLLGQITGWDLPRPAFDVWLHGRLDLQRELEDAQAEARAWSARDATPEPFNIRPLMGPTFAELSRIRGEHRRAARADQISRLTDALAKRGAA